MTALSGGQQSRAALATVLVDPNSYLLLDEPTNHLDLQATRWLERYLAGHRGGALIVSHDRYLLDRLVDRIVELEHGRLTNYPGNYSKLRPSQATATDHPAASICQGPGIHRQRAGVHRPASGRSADQGSARASPSSRATARKRRAANQPATSSPAGRFQFRLHRYRARPGFAGQRLSQRVRFHDRCLRI